MENKEVPTGVKIISVLQYIIGSFGIIFGLMYIQDAYQWGFSTNDLFGLLGILGLVLGIIMLILGILRIFIGRGLWKARRWARIAVIVITIIEVLFLIYFLTYLLPNPIILIYIMVNLVIGVYLLFGKRVKEAFSNQQ